jgi:Flp pilus assembly protein TadB
VCREADTKFNLGERRSRDLRICSLPLLCAAAMLVVVLVVLVLPRPLLLLSLRIFVPGVCVCVCVGRQRGQRAVSKFKRSDTLLLTAAASPAAAGGGDRACACVVEGVRVG